MHGRLSPMTRSAMLGPGKLCVRLLGRRANLADISSCRQLSSACAKNQVTRRATAVSSLPVTVSGLVQSGVGDQLQRRQRLTGVRTKSPDELEFLWDDGKRHTVDSLWLRDHCTCSACRHSTSLHRNFDTFSLSHEQRTPSCVEIVQSHGDHGDRLVVTWSDGHASRFPVEWLQLHCRQQTLVDGHHPASLHHMEQRAWSAAEIQRDVTRVGHGEFFSDSAGGLAQVVAGLRRHGLAFVLDVPCNEASTLSVGRRLGGIARTIYSDLWETAPAGDTTDDGTAEADDRAYSHAYLGLHTDGVFSPQPPAVQVFHSYVMGESVTTDSGSSRGESLFSDGLRAAERLRSTYPDSYDYLSKTRLTYQFYTRDAHRSSAVGNDAAPPMLHAVAEHPVLRCDAHGNLLQICYNNHHRTAQQCTEAPTLYTHLRRLHEELNTDEAVFRVLLEPGTVALVDNQCLLHGRMAFSGWRLLRGCYLSTEQYECAMREHLLPRSVLDLS